MICIALIPVRIIDNSVARNLKDEQQTAVRYVEILGDRSTMAWLLTILTFHLSNAAVMPLVGQLVSSGGEREALSFGVIVIVISRYVIWFERI